MSRGYIDSSIEPGSVRQGYLLAAIRAKGLTLHRVHRDGKALRLTGPGVFITAAAGLGSIDESDLEPPGAGELHTRTAKLRR